MSKNTCTATSAALAPVWARRATDPVTPAATPSPSVSAQFTARETSTLRRVVSLLVVSAIPGARSSDGSRSVRPKAEAVRWPWRGCHIASTITHGGGAVGMASRQFDYRLARRSGRFTGYRVYPHWLDRDFDEQGRPVSAFRRASEAETWRQSLRGRGERRCRRRQPHLSTNGQEPSAARLRKARDLKPPRAG